MDEQQLRRRALARLIRAEAKLFPELRAKYLVAALLVETSDPASIQDVAWTVLLEAERFDSAA